MGEEEQEIGPWTGTVAVLDVLGFREAGQRTSIREEMEILATYLDFEGAYISRKENLVRLHFTPKGIKQSPGPRTPESKFTAFQDTIVVTMRGLSPPRKTLTEMGRKLYAPFRSALENAIFLRGAVSLGTYYQSANTVVGPAVYEALDWHDRADWIGVILTPSAVYGMERLRHDNQHGGYFVPYKVPMKSGASFDTWALAWPRNFIREDLLELFSESHIRFEHEPKYRNTLTFYDTIQPGPLRVLVEDQEKREKREHLRVQRLTSMLVDKSMAVDDGRVRPKSSPKRAP
jgi:hypothetical protein